MATISDRDVFGSDEIGGFFSGVAKAISGGVKSVGRSVKGAGRATVKIPGLLVHGKVQKAAKQVATAVTRVTDNPVLQAGHFPLIGANIVANAAKSGPKGALAAAHRTAKNPMIKAEIAAAGMIFPPAAPLSAGAIAGMEAASRVNDALKSGDPKKIAGAAFQVAATAALAKSGNPGAARALSAISKVQAGAKLVSDAKKGIPAAKAAVAKVNAKGGNAKELAKMLEARSALKDQKHPDPKVRAKAHATLTVIQKNAPGLLAGVQAAMRVPERVELGRFAVLRTGRILLDGKPIRSRSISSSAHAR